MILWNGKTQKIFLTQFAIKSGKLLKKGEPDLETVSKMMLNDWIRGKIPYFVQPPDVTIDNPNDPKESKIKVPEQNIDSLRTKDNFFNEEEKEKQEKRRTRKIIVIIN